LLANDRVKQKEFEDAYERAGSSLRESPHCIQRIFRVQIWVLSLESGRYVVTENSPAPPIGIMVTSEFSPDCSGNIGQELTFTVTNSLDIGPPPEPQTCLDGYIQ
jgi:hypothetical protein